MKKPTIIDGTAVQAETVIRWLKAEFESGLSGGGFYQNRSIIRRAARNSEFKCYVSGRTVVGFTVFTLGSSRFAIDILEIRQKYRGVGYGQAFAMEVIKMLFNGGASHIEVECAPTSSEAFWRKLGFISMESRYSSMGNPKLMLRA